MTVLFKVQNVKSPRTSTVDEPNLICKVSSKNIIAFNRLLLDEHVVYVSDMITPWECYTVCKNDNEVIFLEWDKSGDSLLIAFEGGDVEVWMSQSWSLNVWHLQYRASFKGERVIGASFFHNGRCLYFHSQKRDFTPFSTCERLNYCPTLTKMGDSPLKGFIAVISTGFITACYTSKYENLLDGCTEDDIKSATQSFMQGPDTVDQCSIHNSPNGIVYVGIVYSSRKSAVRCVQVKLDLCSDENIQITCKKIPQLILEHRTHVIINNVKWLMVANEESIIVSYVCDEGSFLDQWILNQKNESPCNLFKISNTEMFTRCSWTNIGRVLLKGRVKELCVSSFPCDYFPIYALLIDNSIQFFEGGLNGFNHFIFDSIRDDRLLGQEVVSADVSALNQVMIIFDNYGYMYALQLFNPFQDKNYKPNNLSMSLALLEYSIKTGIDSNDILLTNMNLLDVLMEKLTDNFTRQQPSVKQYYYSGFLSIKSNMCRMQTRQHDFDHLIHLHSISITFKSLLRPSDLNTQEKSPGDNLSNILSEYVSDIDKVLCNLDARDFTVEPSTLQSLQQIIQWVSDLTIIMLNKLPEDIMTSKLNKKQGYDICRDAVAINLIRELLVIIRIWGLLNSLCLPVYMKSVENVDVLAIVFRILTRLAQNGLEADDILLDECSQLSSQVIIPQKLAKTPLTILGTNHLIQKNSPFLFTAAVEPATFLETDKDKQFFSRDSRDGVTNILLGAKCSINRQCVRCGFINSVNKVEKTAAMKAWCNRWQICHCGGFWKSVSDSDIDA